MTAEVAVMNRSAVALAADSKVTVGTTRGAKTYDTVNKVFSLSKVHPVGVMIYENSECMGYPWETIVKEYRASVGNAKRDTIFEWSAHFIKYVEGFGEVTDEAVSSNIERVCSSWFEWAWNEADDIVVKGSTTGELYKVLPGIMQDKASRLLFGVPEKAASAATRGLAKYHGSIMSAIDDNGLSAEKANPEVAEAAAGLAVAGLISGEPSPDHYSGLVVAGFGDKQLFPALCRHEIDGHVGHKFKVKHYGSDGISRTNRSMIYPFAQRDMVDRFMEGIDRPYQDFLVGLVEEAVSDSCLATLDRNGSEGSKTDAARDEILSAVRRRVADIQAKATAYRQRVFVDPVVDMVAMLPKDELANLAESLVSLASLKGRVTHGLATVGGPIDVALISRGDGFVWVRRKFYFPANLNPHFALNYMRGMDRGENSDDERAVQRSGIGQPDRKGPSSRKKEAGKRRRAGKKADRRQ